MCWFEGTISSLASVLHWTLESSQTWRAVSQQPVLIYVAEGGISVFIAVTLRMLETLCVKLRRSLGRKLLGRISEVVWSSRRATRRGPGPHGALYWGCNVHIFVFKSVLYKAVKNPEHLCGSFQLQRLIYLISWVSGLTSLQMSRVRPLLCVHACVHRCVYVCVYYTQHGRTRSIFRWRRLIRQEKPKSLSSLEFSGLFCPSLETNKAAAFLVCRAALSFGVGVVVLVSAHQAVVCFYLLLVV